MFGSRRLLTVGLCAALLGCSAPKGQPCTSGSQCPLNAYCLFDQCLASATVSQNLSVVVTPLDSTLAPQQLLPDQIQTVSGFSTIMLQPAQTLTGPVALPANCPNDVGYPVQLQFTAPSVIPGIPNSFQFYTDAAGAISATLPVGSYAEHFSTAAACAAPILNSNDIVNGAGTGFDFQLLSFPAPPVADSAEPADGGANSLDLVGQVVVLPDAGLPIDAGLPVGATVRILASADAGIPAGTVISGDQPLLLLDGGLWFGATYLPGGPAALPIWPTGGVIKNPAIGCGLGSNPRATVSSCDQFTVEIAASATLPYLATIDIPAVAPEIDDDGGTENAFLLQQPVTLPFNPMATFDIPIQAEGPDSIPLTSVPIEISTMDGGIAACLPPNLLVDAGITCRLSATGTTDQSTGTFTFPVLPGRYTLTLDPDPPLGRSVMLIDVFGGGQLSYVAGNGNVIAGPNKRQQLVILPAVAASATVRGSVREPDGGPLLPAGEAQLLTLPTLVPMAQQALNQGAFDLAVPPGQYLLLIQPDSSTRFPAYYTTVTAQAGSSARPTYGLAQPGQLAGVVQISVDGGLPAPTPAFLQFYYVTSDPAGDELAIPVASTVTDSRGRWSTAGPPGR